MSRKYANSLSTLRKEIAEREVGAGRLTGAVRGVLGGISPQGEPLVDFCGNSAGHSLVAVTTVPVQPEDVGKEAILLFEDGDPTRPLLVGLVLSPASTQAQPASTFDVKLDGRTLTLSAEHEISIRCGESSITLTRAGKVLIKGAYLLSKSTGPNRIRGGSVHLN